MNEIYLSDIWRNLSLERVSKRTARRHYNNEVKEFDKLVNEFEYYNCNHECGYYAAFYVVNGKMIEPIEKGVQE